MEKAKSEARIKRGRSRADDSITINHLVPSPPTPIRTAKGAEAYATDTNVAPTRTVAANLYARYHHMDDNIERSVVPSRLRNNFSAKKMIYNRVKNDHDRVQTGIMAFYLKYA
jgi:hypothetical protein